MKNILELLKGMKLRNPEPKVEKDKEQEKADRKAEFQAKQLLRELGERDDDETQIDW